MVIAGVPVSPAASALRMRTDLSLKLVSIASAFDFPVSIVALRPKRSLRAMYRRIPPMNILKCLGSGR